MTKRLIPALIDREDVEECHGHLTTLEQAYALIDEERCEEFQGGRVVLERVLEREGHVEVPPEDERPSGVDDA